MNNKKKIVLLVVAFVLTIAASVGVTLAWLTAKSGDVTNTFAPSTINIELTETEDGDNKTFLMVPGHELAKNPTVVVEGGSQKCYVFVRMTKANEPDTYLNYSIASGWTLVNGKTDVYYKVVESSDTNQSFIILTDNKVTVKQEVTKTQMDTLKTSGEAKYPKLTFKAYAMQYWKTANTAFTVAEAWAEAEKLG